MTDKLRRAVFGIITGTSGTGKSEYFKKEIAPTNKRNLVLPANALDPAWSDFPKIKPERYTAPNHNATSGNAKRVSWWIPGINDFTGIKVLDVSELETDADIHGVFRAVCSIKYGMMSGALMIDDYKNWIYTKGTLPKYVRSLFNDRRHRELDIFMASHNYQDINSDLMGFDPVFIMFKCTSPPNATVMKKMIDPDGFMKVFSHVNQAAEANLHYKLAYKPGGS